MSILLCIEDCNQYLGGVDIADQFRSYYDTPRFTGGTTMTGYAGLGQDNGHEKKPTAVA